MISHDVVNSFWRDCWNLDLRVRLSFLFAAVTVYSSTIKSRKIKWLPNKSISQSERSICCEPLKCTTCSTDLICILIRAPKRSFSGMNGIWCNFCFFVACFIRWNNQLVEIEMNKRAPRNQYLNHANLVSHPFSLRITQFNTLG